MQSQDTYRLQLQQLAASIKAWSGFVADVARVEVEGDGAAWRFAMSPKAPGACPVEIVLNGSQLKCDLRVAGETVEDVTLPSLEIVLPLMQAVAEGRVHTRRIASAATGLPLGVSTHIRLPDGQTFEPPSADCATLHGGIESRDTHYLPYRKPTSRT